MSVASEYACLPLPEMTAKSGIPGAFEIVTKYMLLLR